MIEVRVRYQHEIDLWKFVRREGALHETHRPESPQTEIHANARIERRVCQDAQTVEVDEDGRVSEPRKRHGIVRPSRGRRLVRSAWDVPADFFETLPDEPGAPRRGHADPRGAASSSNSTSSHECAAVHRGARES